MTFARITQSDKFLAVSAVLVQYFGLLVLFKLLASQLDPKLFAEYMLFIAATNLVLGLPFTAIQQAILRFVPGIEQRNSLIFIASAFQISVAFLLLLTLAQYLLRFIPTLNILAETYHASLVMSFTLFEALKIYILAYENSRQKRKSYLLLNLLEYTSKILLIGFLILFKIPSLLLIVAALTISNSFIVIYWMLVGNLDFHQIFYDSLRGSQITKKIIIFALPVACWSIFGWLRDMSGRYIVESFLTREDVASFAVLCTLTSLLPGFLSTIVGNYFVPIIYANHNSGKKSIEQGINTVILLMLFFSTALVLISLLVSDFFVAFVAAKKYLFLSKYLPYTLIAYSFYSVSMIATTELYAKGKVGILFLPNVVSGVAGALAMYVFTISYGFLGAINGYVFGYITYSVTTLLIIIFYRKPCL